MNLLPLRRDVARPDAPTDEEKEYLEELGHFLREETGYQMIQGTKPQTLAYGLTDSPVGLAAWIVEKFRTWSDCGGDVERRFTKDELLTNITHLLGHRRHRLLVLAVLRAPARQVAAARRRAHRGAHRATPRSPRRSSARRAPGPRRSSTSSDGR